MTRLHYHVGANVPGYLPETDVQVFTSKRDAFAAALEIARDYRDADYRVLGGYGDYVAYRRPASDYDLGVHIWSEPCPLALSECQDESD